MSSIMVSSSLSINHFEARILFRVVKSLIVKVSESFVRNSFAPCFMSGMWLISKLPVYWFRTPSRSISNVFFLLYIIFVYSFIVKTFSLK